MYRMMKCVCTITATAVLLATGAPTVAQQFVYKAPTPADWAAMAKLPDFSGVWERGGGGGGQRAPQPAGGAAAAPGRGAGGGGAGGQRAAAAPRGGGRGG